MRRNSLAVVLAVASGSLLLSAAQPGELADVHHGLHAAAVGTWAVADLHRPQATATPASSSRNPAR